MENRKFQAIEKKKRFLRRYRNNVACINRLEEKLSALDHKIKSVKSPSYSGMPRGSIPVTTAELLSDKIELEERIARLKDKGKIIKEEILSEIDSLEDSRYCEILEAYFIYGYTLSEISENMGYTERHIYSLYKDAMEALISVSVQ